MSSKLTALSALQQAGLTNTEFHRSGLSVQELHNASLVRIHALRADSLVDTLSAAGIRLPIKVGESIGHDPVVMCLRPAEWLVSSTSLAAGELPERLMERVEPASALADHTAILDASDGLAIFRLAGAAAPWLLAKLSGLDFIGSKNDGQHCARTRLGQVAVVVSYHPREDDPSDYVYDLIFDRSIARYVWELLQHSADHAEELLVSTGPTPLNATGNTSSNTSQTLHAEQGTLPCI